MTLKGTYGQFLIHEWQAATWTLSLLPRTEKASPLSRVCENKDKDTQNFLTEDSFLSGLALSLLEVYASGDSCEEKC